MQISVPQLRQGAENLRLPVAQHELEVVDHQIQRLRRAQLRKEFRRPVGVAAVEKPQRLQSLRRGPVHTLQLPAQPSEAAVLRALDGRIPAYLPLVHPLQCRTDRRRLPIARRRLHDGQRHVGNMRELFPQRFGKIPWFHTLTCSFLQTPDASTPCFVRASSSVFLTFVNPSMPLLV